MCLGGAGGGGNGRRRLTGCCGVADCLREHLPMLGWLATNLIIVSSHTCAPFRASISSVAILFGEQSVASTGVVRRRVCRGVYSVSEGLDAALPSVVVPLPDGPCVLAEMFGRPKPSLMCHFSHSHLRGGWRVTRHNNCIHSIQHTISTPHTTLTASIQNPLNHQSKTVDHKHPQQCPTNTHCQLMGRSLQMPQSTGRWTEASSATAMG